MSRRILITCFYLLWYCVPVLAQLPLDCNFSLKGKIYDLNTKEPLAFVSVQLEGTNLGIVSADDGFFQFENLCEKEYDLVFSFLGYKTVKHHHDFHHPYLEIFLAPEEYTLESIVVEAEASQSGLNSLNSTKLSKEELAEVATSSFAEAASQIAGVNMLQTGQNIAKPMIHGLHSNRILVMNNGLRHEFQNWGADHAPEIDPSLADHLEVVKGAGTVRFGPDALGGVILIDPPKMELSTPLRGEVSLTGKSNGQSGEGTLELQKGFKWLSLLGGTSYVKQGDLSAPNYLLTNTGKEELSYYGGFRIHPIAELDIEGYYSHFDQTLGLLSGSVFGNLEDIQAALEVDTPLYTMPFSYDIGKPRQETSHDIYKASASYVGKTQAFKLQYGRQLNTRKEFGVRRVDAPNIDLELRTESVDFEWRHPSIGGLSGKFGGQWLQKANDNLPGTNTVPFIPNYDEERLGFYLIEALEIGTSTLELGLRYDYFESFITGREPDNTIYRNNIFYRNFSGTIGWKKSINEFASFQTNFGTAWRPPDVAELYRFGQHSFILEYGLWRYTIDDRFDFVSTAGGILTEEDRAVPVEVGYKWINTYTINKENFRSEITGYINYIQNYIYSKPAGVTRTARGYFAFFIYDQTDALFWGLDMTNEWTHSQNFRSELKGSYLWAKQLNPEDFFAGLPPVRLDYAINYNSELFGLDKSRFRLGLSYTFEQFQHPRIFTLDDFLFAAANGLTRFDADAADFDILPPPSGFFLADFSWVATIKKLEWRFQVRNLLNTSYRNYTDRMRYFADDLGRNFILTLSYKI